MSFSNITIPSFTTVIPVDTRSNNLKVLFLPVASTNSGRIIMIKDYYGTWTNSTCTISTTGFDLIDDINWTVAMRSSFLTASFLSDGLRSWRTTGWYTGSYTALPSLPYQSNLLVDLRGSSYSAGGSTWTNSVDNSTWTMTNTTYDATNGGPLFNGSSSFAYRSSLTNWNGLTTTIICFYFKSSTATDGQFLTVNRTSVNISNQLFINQNQAFDYSSNFGFNFNPTSAINTTGLFMFAFVKNGATGTFYNNGLANGTQTGGLTVTVTNADFCIGKDYRDNLRYLAGTVKRYIIYNIALSASDIANIYSILTS